MNLASRAPRARLLTVLFLACALALPTGCGPLLVGPASPHPNVLIPDDAAPGAIVLAPGIADAFVLPRSPGLRAISVVGWRTTLEAGFHDAFPSGRGGRTLEILAAELSFSPAALGPGGVTGGVVGHDPLQAPARATRPARRRIGILAGTARAREMVVHPRAVTDNASKAVEALYETLAAELLGKRGG